MQYSTGVTCVKQCVFKAVIAKLVPKNTQGSQLNLTLDSLYSLYMLPHREIHYYNNYQLLSARRQTTDDTSHYHIRM